MRGTAGNNPSSPFISYLFQRFARLPDIMPARMYADDTQITYADVHVNSIQPNLNHNNYLGNLNN